MDEPDNRPLTKFIKQLQKEEINLLKNYIKSEKYEDLDKSFDDLILETDEN